MTGPKRLAAIGDVAAGVALPSYVPADHGAGIVHIGVGAFFRAHLAAYTDAALGTAGGDWRIVGVSPRSTDIADALNQQNGLYTLLECGAEGTKARLIASIAGMIAVARDRDAVMAALVDPAIRIVSLTVTEKAYGIDRASNGVDPDNPVIAADLADPTHPSGVIGVLVEALRRRRAAGIAPFTVLCCDNLPDNGRLTRAGVIDFARRTDAALASFIEVEVAFPSTMVDRITPAPTQQTLDDACRLTGCVDMAAVETEPFTQWVIEDNFPAGRPQWEAGGAIFTSNVAPYERMKLRMLNGAHSMLAYAGFLSGHTFVRGVMADADLAALVRRHLDAAAATLPPLDGADFVQYGDALAARFANPAIAHETYQIAMDGSEKLPQRIFGPAVESLEAGMDFRPFAFAIAAWMRYCLGRTEDGASYALRDPREEEIRAALDKAETAETISIALHGLPGLFPARLVESAEWRSAVANCLDTMLRLGMAGAVRAEAAQIGKPGA